jgi:hypothetical protein
MKRSIFAASIGLASILSFSAVIYGEEGKQDFNLVNKTGYDIKSVFVSPSKSSEWEDDVLGKDTLEDGDSWDIKFHRSSHACKWDLKVVYDVDSSTAVWNGIDLCQVQKITIRYNKKTDTTSANFD